MPAIGTGQPPSRQTPAAASAAAGDVYKHGVKLTLVGGYAALTRYMESWKALPVGFYWARAELDAGAHPEISLTLTLYTLSLERHG
jgi:MSHA biogenesis protein MshJ